MLGTYIASSFEMGGGGVVERNTKKFNMQRRVQEKKIFSK